MREVFSGWYAPTSETAQQLWDSGTLILDASALLAPYRMGVDQRERYFDVIETFKGRFVVPYQAALEYQENRLRTVDEQRDAYAEIRGSLAAAEKSLLQRRAAHSGLDRAAFTEVVQRALAGVLRHVDLAETSHPEVIGRNDDDDSVRRRWDDLIGAGVLTKFEIPKGWTDWADARYETATPPGFLDSKKDKVGRQYGDLIIWCEILALAEVRAADGEACPMLFVTNDLKNDWWREHAGRRLGPHPLLTEELRAKGGNPFWMYSVDGFIGAGSEVFGWEPIPEGLAVEADTPPSKASEWLGDADVSR